jgi:hypothetical protein
MRRKKFMFEEKLNSTKLKMIKKQVIEIEAKNIIKKESNDSIVSSIKKYIEKVVNMNVN